MVNKSVLISTHGPFIAKMKKEFIIINPLQERKKLLCTESGFAKKKYLIVCLVEYQIFFLKMWSTHFHFVKF